MGPDVTRWLTLTEGQAYAMECECANRGRGALVCDDSAGETGVASAQPDAVAHDRRPVADVTDVASVKDDDVTWGEVRWNPTTPSMSAAVRRLLVKDASCGRR